MRLMPISICHFNGIDCMKCGIESDYSVNTHTNVILTFFQNDFINSTRLIKELIYFYVSLITL